MLILTKASIVSGVGILISHHHIAMSSRTKRLPSQTKTNPTDPSLPNRFSNKCLLFYQAQICEASPDSLGSNPATGACMPSVHLSSITQGRSKPNRLRGLLYTHRFIQTCIGAYIRHRLLKGRRFDVPVTKDCSSFVYAETRLLFPPSKPLFKHFTFIYSIIYIYTYIYTYIYILYINTYRPICRLG